MKHNTAAGYPMLKVNVGNIALSVQDQQADAEELESQAMASIINSLAVTQIRVTANQALQNRFVMNFTSHQMGLWSQYSDNQTFHFETLDSSGCRQFELCRKLYTAAKIDRLDIRRLGPEGWNAIRSQYLRSRSANLIDAAVEIILPNLLASAGIFGNNTGVLGLKQGLGTPSIPIDLNTSNVLDKIDGFTSIIASQVRPENGTYGTLLMPAQLLRIFRKMERAHIADCCNGAINEAGLSRALINYNDFKLMTYDYNIGSKLLGAKYGNGEVVAPMLVIGPKASIFGLEVLFEDEYEKSAFDNGFRMTSIAMADIEVIRPHAIGVMWVHIDTN